MKCKRPTALMKTSQLLQRWTQREKRTASKMSSWILFLCNEMLVCKSRNMTHGEKNRAEESIPGVSKGTIIQWIEMFLLWPRWLMWRIKDLSSWDVLCCLFSALFVRNYLFCHHRAEICVVSDLFVLNSPDIFYLFSRLLEIVGFCHSSHSQEGSRKYTICPSCELDNLKIS